MDQESILKLYSISMNNENMSFNGKLVNYKRFLGGNYLEWFFDQGYDTPESIAEDILPDIQYIINGNNPPLDSIKDNSYGGDGTFFIILYPDTFRSHKIGSGEIIQTIPIEHFKIIAEAWKDFLLQPPLQLQELKN
jgi:hypothetical protein